MNRTRSEAIYPGGKGINVSLCLQRLGMETRALGFAAGRIGQAIRDMLDDLDCPHELLELSGGGQSRINVKFRGTASQPETAVNGRGPGLGEADLARLLARLEDLGPEDALVISGMGPVHPLLCIPVGEGERGRVSDGIGLHWGGPVAVPEVPALPHQAQPLRAGSPLRVDDLDYLGGCGAGRPGPAGGGPECAGVHGPCGAFLLTEDQRLYLAPACGGQARSTVGAGDALVAGFLTGLRQTEDFVQALQLGVAAGCAAAFSDWLPRWGGDPGYGGQDPGGVGPLLTEFEQKKRRSRRYRGISASY